MPKMIDLAGKRFGRLIVLRLSAKKRHNKLVWVCVCDCGTEKEIKGGDLRSNKTRSCGCFMKECVSRRRKGKPPKCQLPEGFGAMRAVIRAYQRGAKQRNLEWTLTQAECLSLFSADCFYCGAPPSNCKGGGRYNGEFVYSGIDRIDNSLGYSPSNTVPCCWMCNGAKKDVGLDYFLQWAKTVAARHCVTV